MLALLVWYVITVAFASVTNWTGISLLVTLSALTLLLGLAVAMTVPTKRRTRYATFITSIIVVVTYIGLYAMLPTAASIAYACFGAAITGIIALVYGKEYMDKPDMLPRRKPREFADPPSAGFDDR